jgi:peptidoglycan/xylan/chitin deacetylase (PgdA/CDA1 family)
MSRRTASAVIAVSAALCLLAAVIASLTVHGTATLTLPTSTPTATARPVAPAPVPAAVTTVTRAAAARLHANELGAVPVLMFHQIVPAPKRRLDISIAAYRAELSGLYRSGYRTVTVADLVNHTIDVPAGKSPMVLTFDDSSPSQYRELAGGRIDPTTAIGQLLEIAKRYGETRPVATMYVNGRPFGNHPEYLRSLVRLGMELGDHTVSHANLRRLAPRQAQQQLVLGQEVIRRAVPGYAVQTMALPYGAHPANRLLDRHGGFGRSTYTFQGVVLTGSNPVRPYSKGFQPLELARIVPGPGRFESTYWEVRLRRTRYVSDGDPTVVSFPKELRADVDPRFATRTRPY